ncbi:MAG: metal-binding protein ZinT [Chitinophagaceae bacterium]|nr:metal-binding protein ZinT [Chitinophagaceae bacterium]
MRFIFKKVEGDADTPQFIQFSDHRIAPAKADHYHLYWGNDRAALLEEADELADLLSVLAERGADRRRDDGALTAAPASPAPGLLAGRSISTIPSA